MLPPSVLNKSLQELEHSDWEEPKYDSYLVTTMHRLRESPCVKFGVEDLRIMIGRLEDLRSLSRNQRSIRSAECRDNQDSSGNPRTPCPLELPARGITNKNAIPFDTYPIFKPGGIRVGTPAVTTRGTKEEDA